MTLVGVGLPAGGGGDSLKSFLKKVSCRLYVFKVSHLMWHFGSAASPEISEMSMSVGNSLF